MTERKRLIQRLDDIGASLQKTGNALALLGLGSVGIELERLDVYSDLDFFAIVKEGYKIQFIENLDWLSNVHPIAYRFKNTDDGYKLLFEDSIFCEFAVFEPQELEHVAFAPGRVVWQDDAFDATLATPKNFPQPPQQPDVAWEAEEALTNLYVGLGRYHRGEKLSAARFIQNYAVDHIIEISGALEGAASGYQDGFSKDRRYERRHPIIANHLPRFIQGYERSVESARAILAFLEEHFSVNVAMRAEILKLCNKKLIQ